MFGTIINVTRNVWWLAGLPAMNVDQGCHIERTNGMSYIYNYIQYEWLEFGERDKLSRLTQ